MVRKAIERKLVSEIDDDVDRFFDLYSDNQHRHGTPPFPRRYFEALRRTFGADCEVLTVLDTGGPPVSGVLSFYFRDEVLPYYAGDDREPRATGRQRLQVLGADAARRASAGCASSTTAAPSATRARSTSRRTGDSSRSRCTTSTA